MKMALVEANTKQTARDETRRRGAWNINKPAKRADDGALAESGRQAAIIQRQQMLAERTRKADEARSIF
jgi:hypothetical protein